MVVYEDLLEVYVGLARIYDGAMGTSRATDMSIGSPLYVFNQEPTLTFVAPFEWLVSESIRVEDVALYERAVDVARQLIEDTTAEGDDYIPWLVEQYLQPFIAMHERTPAAAST